MSRPPAIGAKMFIQRPGVNHYLTSFNFGFRIKNTKTTWSSCEIETFAISKAVQRFEFFIRLTGKPSVALVDAKATWEAFKRLQRGELSTNRKLQDFLVNLSSKRESWTSRNNLKQLLSSFPTTFVSTTLPKSHSLGLPLVRSQTLQSEVPGPHPDGHGHPERT